ncbi:MAG: hypothetical protein MI861_04525, partial [Pirellulales bacterium]|nr:hypothetical protein [Pirellulales bacterium]
MISRYSRFACVATVVFLMSAPAMSQDSASKAGAEASSYVPSFAISCARIRVDQVLNDPLIAM